MDKDTENRPTGPAAEMHAGHRKRMRERFRLEGGFDSFNDIQILELLLFYGRARGDTNPTAHELIDTFGSLKGVLEADASQLMKVRGVGEESATLIGMVRPLVQVWKRCQMTERSTLQKCADALLYCQSLLSGMRVEKFYVICLDAGCRVLGKKRISEGSLTEVAAYPRLVVQSALDLNAHSVILCHNHPGGTKEPSSEDLRSTVQLKRLLRDIGITLADHIIVAGDSAYSMAQNGDL